jgi:flap endonuclease-1
VKGYGPKKSLKLLQNKGNLENALDTISESELNLSSDEIMAVRKIFLEPTITQDYTLCWSKPDPSVVIHILCDEHQFSRERVEPILKNFSSLDQLTKQKNLFDF